MLNPLVRCIEVSQALIVYYSNIIRAITRVLSHICEVAPDLLYWEDQRGGIDVDCAEVSQRLKLRHGFCGPCRQRRRLFVIIIQVLLLLGSRRYAT